MCVDGAFARFSAALFLAAAMAGCATYQTQPPPPLAELKFTGPPTSGTAGSGPQVGDTTLALAERTFAAALWQSASSPDAQPEALKAYNAGIAMLTLQCDTYLLSLGAANQRASNERKQVGLAGGFASAIMGLTGATAKAIAGTATTFSFAASSMDAASSTFLFADAAKSLGGLVRSAEAAYSAAAADRTGDLDYAGAVVLLTGYSELCQPSKIRALVDEAISTARIAAETPGRQSASAEAQIVMGRLIGVLKRPIDETDAIALHAWYTGTPSERSAVKASSPFVSDLLKPPATETALAASLTPVFAPLSLKGDPVAARWSAGAAQYRKTADARGAPAVGFESAKGLFAAPVMRVVR